MHGWWHSTWARYAPYDPCAPVSRATASIGDIDWVGRPHEGTTFLMQSLTGWWAGGAPRGGPVPFETGDGGVRGDVHYGGRVITIRGKIFTESGADQLDAFDQLAGVFATNRWQTLTVDEPERGIARQLLVSPRDIPDPQPITDQVAQVTWMLASAEYPLLDVTRQSKNIPTGGVDCVNEGTYPADLTLTLTGPLSGSPGISWPAGNGIDSGAWRYSGIVAAGQTIQVNLTEETIRDPATSSHTGQLGAGTWLRLPPRGITRLSRLGSGSGTISAAWRSSWA